MSHLCKVLITAKNLRHALFIKIGLAVRSLVKFCLGILGISSVSTFVLGVLYGFSYNGMLSPFGTALACFVGFSFFFLGFFHALHFLRSNSLESNPWVVDVKEMDRWFNTMYDTWLFYHDHIKWAQWNTLLSSVLTLLFGTSIWLIFVVLSAPRIIPENAWANSWNGWGIATMLMVLFAFSWYLYYTSVDRTPSPYPKGRLGDLPRRL